MGSSSASKSSKGSFLSGFVLLMRAKPSTYVYKYTNTCVYMYIYIYIHLHVYMYVCMYVCMHVSMYTYLQTYIE